LEFLGLFYEDIGLVFQPASGNTGAVFVIGSNYCGIIAQSSDA